MREGEIHYIPEETKDEPPPSEVPESQRRETSLERIRRTFREYPPLRPITISLGLMVGSFGGIFAEKAKIRADLQTELRQAEMETKQEESREESLKEKYGQLDHLFGTYSPFHQGERLPMLEREKEAAQSELREFSWFVDNMGYRSPINQFVERMLEKIESHARKDTETMAEQEPRDSLEITPIETQTARLEPETLREILQMSFPKGWVNEEVASIEQIDEEVPMHEAYGIDGVAAGVCRDGYGEEKSNIVLAKPTKDDELHYILNGILPHELGHANDWENDRDMAKEERVDLLLAVADRLDDEDRHPSTYVEMIKNADQQLERYIKAREYWAEICERYFYMPHRMNIKDYQIVERVVKKADPTFDIQEANDAKLRLTNNVVDRQAALTELHQP